MERNRRSIKEQRAAHHFESELMAVGWKAVASSSAQLDDGFRLGVTNVQQICDLGAKDIKRATGIQLCC
jgi:hypothetical protein